MPRKIEWTVRVVNGKGSGSRYGSLELPGLWVEQLQRMGFAKELASFETYNVIEFYAPRGADSQAWASSQAELMRSFHINAQACPKLWPVEDEDPHQLAQLLAAQARAAVSGRRA